MSFVFTTKRRGLHRAPDGSQDDPAFRLALPVSVSDALSPVGLQAARAIARRAALQAQAKVAASYTLTPTDPHEIAARIEATQYGTGVVDPVRDQADARLVRRWGHDLCLKYRVLPWRSSAGRVIVIAARVEDYLPIHDALRATFGEVHLAMVSAEKLDRALGFMCHRTLMKQAELRTQAGESCRDWHAGKAFRWGAAITCILIACLIAWPTISFALLCGWAIFILCLQSLLKIAAALGHLRASGRLPDVPLCTADLPSISVLVPLFREHDIAGALVRRLSQIDYPVDRLDVCLVLEADDGTTQKALAATTLPTWMRAIKVPLGTLQTKPRALNYALSFAKGEIIGVYDAEDAPEPDQLRKVAARFAAAGPDVACLQGRLDFYNSRSNWLARCFTVEYASWFRMILPGLERLGLVIPLGGTTLFFRRDILEELGGWDAHNVTEDADLGIRLARHGYQTQIIDTVTQEEANARAWPWVKQRSRWLKGYAITYGVHMRSPRELWADLGAWRFFGVQLLFGGTITQFLLAPLLWSFWLMVVGLPHPLAGVMSPGLALTLSCVFLASEAIGIAVSMLAVSAAGKRELIPWTPTLHLYFPLAALAAYKGIIELATKPFYWDKTTHGIFAPTPQRRISRAPQQPPHQVAAE